MDLRNCHHHDLPQSAGAEADRCLAMSDLDPSMSVSRHPEPKQTETQTKESTSQSPQENMFPSWCIRYRQTSALDLKTSISILLLTGLARDSVGLPQEKKVTGMDMMKVLR